MTLFLVLFVLASKVFQSHGAQPPSKNIHNLEAAMTGYNIFKGNPYAHASRNDPGFDNMEAIFQAYKQNGAGESVPDDNGLTINKGRICNLEMESQVYSTVYSYQNKLLSSYSTGNELATNLELDVKGELEPVKGAKLEVATKVPPLVKSAFTANGDFKNNVNFFTKQSGIVTMNQAFCSVYTVKISQTLPPQFHPGFIEMLRNLQDATDGDESAKDEAAKHLIENFGTHYLKFSEMGARIAITKRLTRKEASQSSLDELKECTRSSVEAVFGLIKQDSSKCAGESTGRNSRLADGFLSQYTTTYGSPPNKNADDPLNDWANKEFDTPLPIRMILEPIVNIFRNAFMENVKDREGEPLKYREILKWLLPKYLSYCEDNKDDLGIANCNIHDMERKGCGWNDDCDVDQVCKNDKSSAGYTCINPERGYEVLIQTSNINYAGTSANIEMYVFDSVGVSTDKIPVSRLTHDPYKFYVGKKNFFEFKSKKRLGFLSRIRIWHNNSGTTPGWHLKWLKIKDKLRGRVYTFNCNKWVSKRSFPSIDCEEDSVSKSWGIKKKKKAKISMFAGNYTSNDDLPEKK